LDGFHGAAKKKASEGGEGREKYNEKKATAEGGFKCPLLDLVKGRNGGGKVMNLYHPPCCNFARRSVVTATAHDFRHIF
jgi:hypothetical protein